MSTTPARCWAEINSDALVSNIRRLQKLGPEIMAVVKADAYGHGIDLIAPILLQNGVSHFAVATVAEGIRLRSLKNMDQASIYLMAAVLSEEADEIVRQRLIPFATDTQFVRTLSTAASAACTKAPVHVEVDTGIGRAGIAPAALAETVSQWNSLPGIVVTGICTHFTAADASDGFDSAQQLRFFVNLLNDLPRESIAGLSIHAANSPAALRLPFQNATLFRPGLLLYGIAPSQAMSETFAYDSVLSLKARVLLVRRLPAGSHISYSRTYRLKADATIATIGIGYGDGYPRRLSGIGSVLLPGGTRAPIRGRVCMDQICVEVPEAANIKPGDTVTLIGSVGDDRTTVVDIASKIDAVPHEITTCLTQRVDRFVTLGIEQYR